jgi:hypothetical protein
MGVRLGPWTLDLGPWTFSIKVINSLGNGFVGCAYLDSRTNFKLSHAAALAELRQLLSQYF